MAVIALAVYIVFITLSHFLVGWLSTNDPRTPSDEREILIEFKASRIGYISQTLLVLAAILAMIHDYGHNWGYGNLVFGAIIVAEVVKYGTQIYLFRKEA